jgi:hypothetical protein
MYVLQQRLHESNHEQYGGSHAACVEEPSTGHQLASLGAALITSSGHALLGIVKPYCTDVFDLLDVDSPAC